MEKHFRSKYRIRSTRLVSRNYGKKGLYFITIDTKGMVHYFGKILDGKVQLSELGRVVESEWLKTPSIRPDMNITLEEYVIMPNHFHAIIKIGSNIHNDGKIHIFEPGVLNRRHSMEVKGPSAQYKNVSSIVRGFKSVVTGYARHNQIKFEWQPRFYDHIIRNGPEHNRIKKYIIENPIKWQAKIDKIRKPYPPTPNPIPPAPNPSM